MWSVSTSMQHNLNAVRNKTKGGESNYHNSLPSKSNSNNSLNTNENNNNNSLRRTMTSQALSQKRLLVESSPLMSAADTIKKLALRAKQRSEQNIMSSLSNNSLTETSIAGISSLEKEKSLRRSATANTLSKQINGLANKASPLFNQNNFSTGISNSSTKSSTYLSMKRIETVLPPSLLSIGENKKSYVDVQVLDTKDSPGDSPLTIAKERSGSVLKRSLTSTIISSKKKNANTSPKLSNMRRNSKPMVEEVTAKLNNATARNTQDQLLRKESNISQAVKVSKSLRKSSTRVGSLTARIK